MLNFLILNYLNLLDCLLLEFRFNYGIITIKIKVMDGLWGV